MSDKKTPRPPRAPAPLVFRDSVWMATTLTFGWPDRLRILFGVPVQVRLEVPTEKNVGRVGQVTGTVLVGDPRPAEGTANAAAELGGPGAGETGDGAGRA